MSKTNNRTQIITALDVGTTKVVCLIAKKDEHGAITIAGVGHQLAKGIKSGIITDVSEVETSRTTA